mgnify:CR=1 FL=1
MDWTNRDIDGLETQGRDAVEALADGLREAIARIEELEERIGALEEEREEFLTRIKELEAEGGAGGAQPE